MSRVLLACRALKQAGRIAFKGRSSEDAREEIGYLAGMLREADIRPDLPATEFTNSQIRRVIAHVEADRGRPRSVDALLADFKSFAGL
ncbi:MAG: hypothetical protein AB7O71_10775 [Hyphomicrobiaceae bacterium]